MKRRALLAVLASLSIAPFGCGDSGGTANSGGAGNAGATGEGATTTTTGDGGANASGGGGMGGGAGGGTPGWHLTTYFTAVESFFSGPITTITGCLDVDCSSPNDPDNALGDYPDDFVETVVAEGTGLITSGTHEDEYLNWSAGQPGSGFWLDTAPRDAQGSELLAYISAAAHPTVEFGAPFQVLDCGVDQTTARPMDDSACSDFRRASWVVRDRFEDDDEVQHLDLYIGLQTTADMNDDPHFVDQVAAVTTLP